MRADDKKIKRIFKELKVPVSSEERMDDLLASLKAEAIQEEKPAPKRRAKYILRFAVCLLCICVMFSAMVLRSEAAFWTQFRQTLMNFFGFATEQEAGETGINSIPMHVGSKKDLFVELQEAVIDTHNIFLLVKITAPTDIVFTENTGFDHFGFCEGNNYDVNHLLSGSRDCKLLEVMDEIPNVGLYVVSMCFDHEIPENTPVTCFLKDLTADPYGDAPKLLIEGIWSLTFPFERTVVDSITIEGGPEAAFPYIDGTAAVKHIELTPTGMVFLLDVSDLTYELMNVSDTTVSVRLLLIDGSEKTIVSHTPDESFIQGGSISFNAEDATQQQNLEFAEVLNIGEVIGVYIEDVYLPVE